MGMFDGLFGKSPEDMEGPGLEKVAQQKAAPAGNPRQLAKGMRVSFYQGRRPLTGTIAEIQEDGMIEIATSQGMIVKGPDEVMAMDSLKGKKARIRFSG